MNNPTHAAMAPRGFAGKMLELGADTQSTLLRLLIVLIACGVLAAATDTFLTGSNAANLLRQTSLLFVIAAGATIVKLAGGLDLSIGAN
ncbi:MAG: ABC transporter permease, partial [Rubrivivax sp.]